MWSLGSHKLPAGQQKVIEQTHGSTISKFSGRSFSELRIYMLTEPSS
jgi:hypothetical protein